MAAYQVDLRSPQGVGVGCRSRLYSTLAKGFCFPSPVQYERVKRGEFADQAQGAIAQLPYNGLRVGSLGRGDTGSYEEFQSNYIALFEVGGPLGAPSFLYEGEYGGGRMKVMEEVLRFYHHFGLRLSQAKRDRPDHLASELEFMHLLTFKQAVAADGGKDATVYLNAQRDFLRSHLADFVASIAGRVSGSRMPFYADLAEMAHGYCQSDLAYLMAS